LRLFLTTAAVLIALLAAGVLLRHQLAARPASAPYSAADRRMTFALLPLETAPSDPTANQVARATDERLFKSLDENHLWVQLATRQSVERAMRQSLAPRDLARALDVHFLMRGSVARAGAGYEVTLFVVDGETEHVLGSRSIPIPSDALVPRSDNEIDEATGMLIYYGLQVEVERARNKPDAALDVRDLTFRAFVDWGTHFSDDPKRAYLEGESLLKRALALAPDDPLTLKLTAKINLCDCIEAWSSNTEEQHAIAEAAIDHYLVTHPDDVGMLHKKARLYQSRGRFQEQLVLLDRVLSRDPNYLDALEDKARALLKLGRPREALAPATAAYENQIDRAEAGALLAAIHYELGHIADAQRLAQQSAAEMSHAYLTNPNMGTVRLTLIAASAQLHDAATAKAAIEDLKNAVPALTSITAVRKWMHPQANLYGYEPLFDGLRLAGLPE
jgi:tetratricopeptide (TPR) repeat protein